MNPNIEFSIKTSQAYNAVCKPLCQELGLSQTALDILLFLANNPDYKTARDIVEVRHIKANLVSMNVDKLVQEVYLWGKAVYDGGKEVIIDEISDKTLMEKISETAYQKYIYPRHFFGLPADAEIDFLMSVSTFVAFVKE